MRKSRVFWCGAVLLTGAVLFADFALREIGSFLVIEDPLQSAAAIIPLGGEGKPPLRLIEAARLYRAGWAPLVVIVRGAHQNDSQASRGVETGQLWKVSREVLLREGVPASAILVVKQDVQNTREELQAASRALRLKKGSVIIVTSKYHTRRSRLTWHYIMDGRSQAIMRAASPDSFDPALWWHERRVVFNVVREYLGIMNLYVGFPVTPGGG